MSNSVHLARWLKQFAGSDHKFRIVPSTPQRTLHPEIENLVASFRNQFSIGFISRWLSWPISILDILAKKFVRGALVGWEFYRFQPDVVHVLEFQNGGYSYLRAARLVRKLAEVPLLLTPYGSDIYWYQQFPNHRKKIEKLLRMAMGFSAECKRDERLATKFGFSGVFGPTIPAFGSVELSINRSGNRIRNKIAVKGYQNHLGQALNAFKALEQVVDLLAGSEVVVFSCEPLTEIAAKRFEDQHGVKVSVFRPGALSHEGVQHLLSESSTLISLSKSDGISASMIEAMANGAVPIQSKTSCCDEWLDDGIGGFLVSFEDIDEISSRLRFILSNQDFRERAAAHNFKQLSSRMSYSKSWAAAQATYAMLHHNKA